MAKEAGLKTNAILPGTPEMEAFLQVGYPDMTVKKANLIIKERGENPQIWPYSEYERALAFLSAYGEKSRAISTDEGWKRTA